MHLWHRWRTDEKTMGRVRLFGLVELSQRAVVEAQSCRCGAKRAVVRTTDGVVFSGDPLLVKGLEKWARGEKT